MSDEIESSFEWLFRTFLESMGGKQPETIFTDQCQAMMNAIDTIFSCAHHWLCQWHINQNAPSHLGSLNNDSGFKHLWNKCMQRCESEEEFEVAWKSMVDHYDLSNHKWWNGMYNLRHRWATAFSNTKFSAGLLATSRSEGTNSVLKKAGGRTISLYNFVLNYEKIQKSWRANEKTEDTRCRHGKPATVLKNNPLLDHGAEVYTLNVFNLFQVELLESLNNEFIEPPSQIGHFLCVFKMKSYGELSRVRMVMFDRQQEEIKCSCHKFESMGILCRHILKAFNYMNIRSIPEKYIKKRWTKNVRNRVSHKGNGCGSDERGSTNIVSEMVFINQKMRMAYDLVMQCKAHEQTRIMLPESFDSIAEKSSAWLANMRLDDPVASNDLVDEDNNQINEVHIRNPLYVKSRGITNACVQRHWDNKSTKGKKKGNCETSKMKGKGTKRKGNNSQMTRDDQSHSQEIMHVQVDRHSQTDQPLQMTFPNQSYWAHIGGTETSTFSFWDPNL
ncbi:UNVERIFIED_CONTAM: protein FAR1-RELATED SEQUENCE 7 [Sesamum radiatum]|uniref:Protein FAR1-RELATED SEQUENCE 7 n=1 Tax=Sesamum radiatum TaxID=300843 RepID=A0AAW2Q0D8_SESRA